MRISSLKLLAILTMASVGMWSIVLGQTAFVLTSVDRRALPARDSMQRPDGSWMALIELQAASIVFDSAGVLVNSTERDLIAAKMPCEALRLDSIERAAPPSESGGGSLTQISDTTSTGCEHLSTTIRSSRALVRRSADTLYLTLPDSDSRDTTMATTLVGLWFADSIVISSTRVADKRVHVPFGAARLVFVRQLLR
jgi:hypothetical protein